MKVDVRMSNDDQFTVSAWRSDKPEHVIRQLRQQLEAATAIWPELSAYKIDKKRDRTKQTPGA